MLLRIIFPDRNTAEASDEGASQVDAVPKQYPTTTPPTTKPAALRYLLRPQPFEPIEFDLWLR